MEMITTGLSVAELEGQRVELVPDRIEMRKRRGIRILNNNQNANSNTLFANQQTQNVFVGEDIVIPVDVVLPG